MCGICGFMNRLGKNENEIIIEKMLSKITHRGPDGKGAFVKDELAVWLDSIMENSPYGMRTTHFVLFVMVKYITIRN